jgi:outer membrane protein assembly factor BamD (BamD/ComL family)
MNQMRWIFSAGFAVLFVFACNTSKKDELINKIKEAEKELYASEILDHDKGLVIIQQYVDFAKEYPADTLSASYLFKAAEIAMNLKVGSQSVLYFDKILTNYPTFSKAPESLFLKAFVLENQMEKYDQAGELYKQFIAKYPNHPLAKDAKASLEFLGKSPEELIKLFEQKQAGQQSAVK